MENLTYEQAVKKLEELVLKLEKGEMSLDDTVACYDEATKLSGYCEAMLNNAKLRIEELKLNKEND
ncbi:MAG: exodeoxyribonuclease VII small subunit [Clostridia bacterium]|nr:exodeoxyribonuclease VII small subunit [Clostridia bacterium]